VLLPTVWYSYYADVVVAQHILTREHRARFNADALR
jgi:hypothetical protein